VVGGPLLFLGALIEEGRQAAAALRERLRFEELLSRLAAQFVHLPSQEVGVAFESGLQQLGSFFGVDRVGLPSFTPAGDLSVVYAWSTPQSAAPPARLERSAIPWLSEQLLREETVVISSARELPRQAEAERELLRRHGVRSFLVLPLVAGHQVLGCLGFVASSQARDWPQTVVERGRLIADLFASALARQGAEDAMRQAELEAQKSRQELAHFQRVSTIGELTTSLAHELNQPLTAILANAETAARLVRDSRAAGAEELREILADIASEDRRAGEFIKRLRELLRKEEPPRALLEVNALVREIVDLLASDALLRGVALRLDLHPGRLTVQGDRVQLQQVLLNLLVNALEALAESGGTEPSVRVRTEDAGAAGVRVSVRDTGPGLRQATPEGIFEPFYTTKAHGLGMGLSIARSIATAHGGTIDASNNTTRGATFTLTLPAALAGGVLRSAAR
jgi:C4-dicarboxylate-specific signal transduction histidine kinase